MAPSYRNYRTVTIGLSERTLSDYRSYRGTIGVLSESTIGAIGPGLNLWDLRVADTWTGSRPLSYGIVLGPVGLGLRCVRLCVLTLLLLERPRAKHHPDFQQ